jgi:hypothetical protein
MPDAPPLASLGYALVSNPVVVNRVVYIGASNGSFYALNESNGAVLWRDFIGHQATTTCPFARASAPRPPLPMTRPRANRPST